MNGTTPLIGIKRSVKLVATGMALLLMLSGCFEQNNNTNANSVAEKEPAPLIDEDVNIVKSVILDDFKSLTVGDAFDRWQSCESTYWTSFKTDNGIKMVLFDCALKNTPKYAKANLEDAKAKQASYENRSYVKAQLEFAKTRPGYNENWSADIISKAAAAVDFKQRSLVWLWMVNLDGTVELFSANLRIEWNDGDVFYGDIRQFIGFSKNYHRSLQSIYANEDVSEKNHPLWSPSDLKERATKHPKETDAD